MSGNARLKEAIGMVKNKPKEESFRYFGQKPENYIKKENSDEKEAIGMVFIRDLENAVRQLNLIRSGNDQNAPIDMSFSEYAQERWGIASLSDFMNLVGIDPAKRTVQQLMTMPDIPTDARWLLPEIFLEPIRTGFRKPSMYTRLVRDSVPVSALSITVPEIKMSDARMERVAEGESIPMGRIQFGGKSARVEKFGKGISLTNEVVMLSTINMLSPFLEDVGARMSTNQDALAVKTLINGEDATNAAVTVGVTTANSLVWRDFMRVWIQMNRLGRDANIFLSNANTALDVMDLTEFKGFNGVTKTQNINLITPVPTSQDFAIHGLMTDGKIMFINTQQALRRLVLQPLMVDSEKIASRQVTDIYASCMMGFTTIMRDARIIVDKSLAFSGNSFPSWMNVDTYESEEFA